MPVLIIAVVFLLIFLVMGAMLLTATVVEHEKHLLSGKRAEQLKSVKGQSYSGGFGSG